jgi:hypothetical protein
MTAIFRVYQAGNFSEYITMPLPSTRLAVPAYQLQTVLVFNSEVAIDGAAR